MLNRFALFLFIPLPLFLGIGLYTRQFRATAKLLIPLCIFGWLYHPYLIPNMSQPVADDFELRVMTYNVLYNNSNYDAVANVIQTYEPDLIALQEVQPAMMMALQERLAEQYQFSSMGTRDDYGTTAVFSRYPILDSTILDLGSGRPAVVTRVRLEEKDITFASLHGLAYNLWRTKWNDLPVDIDQRTAARDRQVTILLEQLKGESGIVLVGCDCNSYETSGSYRILDHSLDNASRQVGWVVGGGDLDNTRQDTDLLHIDYVWYRGPIVPIRVYKIKDDAGSDHLPVVAVFHQP